MPDLLTPDENSDAGGPDREWTLLGQFARSIGPGNRDRDRITFTVERFRRDPTLHKVSYREQEGTGPSEVCTFTHPSRGGPVWARAWDGDRLSPGILTDARNIVMHPTE